MSESELESLREALKLKEQELELLMAVDKIRDSESMPLEMLASIVKLLVQRFRATRGWLFLLDRETNEMALTATYQQDERLGSLEPGIIRQVAARAVTLDEVAIWAGSDALPPSSLEHLPESLFLAIVPIVMGASQRLGALILARIGDPFDTAEAQLLSTAEDQIDSAVIQGYVNERNRQNEAELRLRQRELQLVEEIDAIRDTVPEPASMLHAIVNLLTESFQAELCWLYLIDRGSTGVVLKAISNHAIEMADLAQGIPDELAKRAMQLDDIAIWAGSDVLPVGVRQPFVEGLHLAAVPVIMGTEQRLGALLLARTHTLFDPVDLQLLVTAEDHIDSAVIQGLVYDSHRHTESQMRLKQQELKLIEAVDEIRDTVFDPAPMLASIVALLADHFHVDLCWLFLHDRETGDVELKAFIDRSQQYSRLKTGIDRELAERVAHLDQIMVWDAQDVLVAELASEPHASLQFAAVPIIMGTEERLGALLLARSGQPFADSELQILDTVEDHIDSAVIQGYARQEHLQYEKELKTIYRLDQIRDKDLPFNEMLDAVLQEVLATIEAEMGFVMLYDRSGKRLEVRAATPHDLFEITPHYKTIDQMVEESLEKAQLIYGNELGGELHSLMCLPLILNEEIIGVLGAINRLGKRGFSVADRRLLRAIGSQVDTAIFEVREKRQLRRVLGRSVDPRVMERLLANPNMDILKGERLELTVLYADLRGSTGLAERTNPEQLVEFVNDYLGQMTEIILSHQGTLDKFVGDEVMALFGAPFPQEDHALRAVRVGLEMLDTHQTIMSAWQTRGVETAPIGVGIATGELTVGEMGCPQHTDYTVIGRAANLGSRICGVAKANELLISQRTYDLVRDLIFASPLPNQSFKGVENDVTVYRVTEINS